MEVSRSAFLRAVAGVTESGLVTIKSSSPLLTYPLSPSSPTADADADAADAISRSELPLPLILTPTHPSTLTLPQTTAWLTHTQPHLERLLQFCGALLFRAFPTPSAPHFADFIDAFHGWADLPYEQSLSYAVRLRVCRRVCTTNEGKRGGLIFHHELAQAPHYPSKLLFFCELPATHGGGGTAITPSWLVLEELQKRYPSFVAQCREKGVVYRSIFPPTPDASVGVGRSWSSFFGRVTHAEVAARMAELGYSGEWDAADCLHLTSPRLPAIRTTADGTEVFFNQMIAQHLANAREFSSQTKAAAHAPGADGAEAAGAGLSSDFIRYGDGSSVDVKALEFAHEVSERHAVELVWERGDIALIDNLLLMHARREFEGDRKVYASLVQ